MPDYLQGDSLCDITDESGAGRSWSGPCTVMRQGRGMVYVKIPGGTVQQVHRHRVRPRESGTKIEIDTVSVDSELIEKIGF